MRFIFDAINECGRIVIAAECSAYLYCCCIACPAAAGAASFEYTIHTAPHIVIAACPTEYRLFELGTLFNVIVRFPVGVNV